MKELLKYLAAGVLIAVLWAAFGGIEWKAPADKVAESEAALEQAVLRSKVSALRDKIRDGSSQGESALAVEDLRKAEARLGELER